MLNFRRWSDWQAITVPSAGVIAHGADNSAGLVEIDLDGMEECEVGVKAVYSNHSITQGVKVYVLGETADAVYETESDSPWGFEMPYVQDGTRYRRFNVDPGSYGKMKILLTYDGGASSSVTVTLKYRTATRQV